MAHRSRQEMLAHDQLTAQGCSEALIQFVSTTAIVVASTLHLMQGEVATAITDVIVGSSLLSLLTARDVERLKILPVALLAVLVREVVGRMEGPKPEFDLNPVLFIGILLQIALTHYETSKRARS